MMSLNILLNILAKINKVSWMGKQILLEDTGHTVGGRAKAVCQGHTKHQGKPHRSPWQGKG